MPSVFTCSPGWARQLLKDQTKVVIATWSEKDSGRLNEWLEKINKLEDEGIPVFVVDCDSCPSIEQELGVKEPGETLIYREGKEAGRLTPGESLDESLSKVKEMAA
jgi:hypothetical protein